MCVNVVTGHSVRGILNGPAIGEAMGELILDGEAKSADITDFAPNERGRRRRRAWKPPSSPLWSRPRTSRS